MHAAVDVLLAVARRGAAVVDGLPGEAVGWAVVDPFNVMKAHQPK